MSDEILLIDNIEDKGLKERWGELVVGKAFSFSFGKFNGIPFVTGFKQVDADNLPPHQVEPEDIPDLQQPQKPKEPTIRENMEWKGEQIEVNMCWNQVGNRIGDDSIDRDYPNSSVDIKSQYYKKIFGKTGITLKKKEE